METEEIVERIKELFRRLPEDAQQSLCNELRSQVSPAARPVVNSVLLPEEIHTMSTTTTQYATPRKEITEGKPGIAVAIKGFSLTKVRNQFLFAFATNQNISNFEAQLFGWDLKDIHLDFLEIPEHNTRDGLWQYGQWISNDNPQTEEQMICNEFDSPISFSTPFEQAPKVALFLSGFHADSSKNLRLCFWTENVTQTGFQIKGHAFGDSVLFNLKVTWIAYASTLKGVHSGRVDTGKFRTWEQPQHLNMGYEPFPANTFSNPPKVMVGFNYLDLKAGTEQNIKGYVSNVNQLGMCWNTDSWGKTVNYGAGLSYIAIEGDA